MLIPSIDLKDGAVVQLVQGERLAIRDDDIFEVGAAVRALPKVQVIDLDAAMGARRQPRDRPADRAARCRAASAAASAPSSARGTFSPPARGRSSPARRCSRTASPTSSSRKRWPTRSAPNTSSPPSTAGAARSSSTAGRPPLPLTAVEAVRALEPYCGEFLYTHVDAEGLMGGTNIDGHSRRPPGDDPPGHGRRRHHDPGGNRRPRRASASTPSSAWRSTRESSRIAEDPSEPKGFLQILDKIAVGIRGGTLTT